MRAFVLALILGVLAIAVPAQTPPADVDNPRGVVFTPSPDHAVIDGYELDLLRPDGSVLQTLNLGKPAIDPATGDCAADVNVQPVSFGLGYSMRLRAVAGAIASDYTPSVNKFNRRPGSPSRLIAR